MDASPKPDLVARVRACIPLALGLVTILLVYAPVIDAPFLWDDTRLLESPAILRLDWPWNYLSQAFYQLNERQSLFYRPLVSFSLALDYALHGKNASGFHLTNVGLHLAVVTQVFLLARRYGARAPAAALGATVFGVLPRLTESVAWIAGRTDVLCTVFILFAWLVYRRSNVRRVLLATAFAILALLSKESGVAIVIAIVLVELWPWPTKAALKRIAPLLGLTTLYLLIRAETLRKAGGGSLSLSLSSGERIWTILEAIGRYTFMMIDPWQPRIQIGLVGAPSKGYVVLGVVAIVAALVIGFRTRKRWTEGACISAILAAVSLGLVIHVIRLPWLVVAADRLLYTPLAALAVAISPRLDAVFPTKRLPTIAVLALAGSLAVTSYRTTALYLDPVEFWVTAVETTPPHNFLPTRNLVGEFARAGLYEDALALLDDVARRSDPTGLQRPLDTIRPTLLVSLGRYSEAATLLDRIPMGQSSAVEAERAQLLANFNRVREAKQLALEVLDRYPDLPSAKRLLRHIELFEKERKKAEDPATPPLDRAILRAHMDIRLGRRSEATAAWLALLSDPKTPRKAADDAMTFLVTFATFENLKRAARIYRSLPNPSPVLLAGLEERESLAQRLLASRPRIEHALGFQFPR